MKLKTLVHSVIELIGAALIAYGVWRWSHTAFYIVAGIFLILISLGLQRMFREAAKQ